MHHHHLTGSAGFWAGCALLALSVACPAWFWPVSLAGVLLVWGSVLLLVQRRKAPGWWYLAFCLVIAVSAWHSFDPRYFMDMATFREYSSGGWGGGELGSCTLTGFLVPMVQMAPFVCMGCWDGWLGKTHLWGLFFGFVGGCGLGVSLACIHP